MGTIFFKIYLLKVFIFMFFNFFILVSHPLLLSLMLIMITVSIIVNIFNSSFNMWFSFILCLIYLGGVLILFIYISSFLPNTKFTSLPFLLVFFVWIMSIVGVLFFYPSLDFFSLLSNSISSFNMLFLFNKLYFLSFSLFYLIFILLISVYYSFFKKMPLRSIN